MVLRRALALAVTIAAGAIPAASGCARISGLDAWEIVDDAAPVADASVDQGAGDVSIDPAVDPSIDPGVGDTGSNESASEGGDSAQLDTGVEAEAGPDLDASVDAASDAPAPECEAGAGECLGLVPRTCDATGHWKSGTACQYVCQAGACTGVCVPGSKRCSGNLVQTCQPAGQWNTGVKCGDAKPACFEGACVTPSCVGMASKCGKGADQSCCGASEVTGGTFKRSYDAVNATDQSYGATVSTFVLDRYEVTVGRYRKFVEQYPASKPAAGSGRNPHNTSDAGWNASWPLPADQAELKSRLKCSAGYQTWTDASGGNEAKPINCLDWYMAYAFCIWDGGRLPTEAEWNYAAAGGGDASGHRVFPWSDPPNAWGIDPTYAVYECLADGNASCSLADLPVVGSRSPKGDARWGQADMAGSLWEWTQDWFVEPYPVPCVDCASLGTGTLRVMRGGGFDADAANGSLLNVQRNYDAPGASFYSHGVRCARSP